jgi:hypothetical protein
MILRQMIKLLAKKTTGILQKPRLPRQKQLFDFNYQDDKLRLEMFLNQVDEIYIIEYAIADRSKKLLLHLKIWDSYD